MYTLIFVFLYILIPKTASAQAIEGVINNLNGVTNAIVSLLMGILVVVFMWGVIKYVLRADNERARTEARKYMTFGVVGMAVVMGVWTLAALVKSLIFPGATNPFTSSGPVTSVTDFKSLVNWFNSIISTLIPFLMGIALIGFIWGIIKYVLHADNEKARKEGKDLMLYGVIAFAVVMSIWTIALFIKDVLFPSSVTPIVYEQNRVEIALQDIHR
jgi:hypothetical protein